MLDESNQTSLAEAHRLKVAGECSGNEKAALSDVEETGLVKNDENSGFAEAALEMAALVKHGTDDAMFVGQTAVLAQDTSVETYLDEHFSGRVRHGAEPLSLRTGYGKEAYQTADFVDERGQKVCL